jgi:trans-2,3-dihydro-3-hydroxyanthranilate isomerase
MKTYQYRLLNVFAESTFGGNPLCVFTDATGLTDTQMQSLALQFNLSETTFILPSTVATAAVRIFTPTFEMAFAGHPTLGSAHVVRDALQSGDAITLEMKAGVIPVSAVDDNWTLTANQPTSRDAEMSPTAIAAMLRINEADVLEGARWVNTGSEQFIVPLASADAVMRVRPDAVLLKAVASNTNRSMVYVFAPDGERGNNNLRARFFFMQHDSVVEDPATGSATANLGGWMLHHGRNPCHFQIEQGEAIARHSHLKLVVLATGVIQVGGRVMAFGQGSVTI